MNKKTAVTEKVFDILGEILAVLTIALYVALIINANWSFIPAGRVLDVLQIIKDYAALVVVLIVGLEAMIKRSFVFKFIFVVMIAVIVIFLFFPGTWNNITKIF